MDDKINKKQEQDNKKVSYPFFSIVIPLWNRQDCIQRCLDSIFSQNFKDYEIIVVDDCSDDGSAAIVKQNNDPRLIYMRHDTNKGVCAARYTGTAAAAGKWTVEVLFRMPR